MVDSASGELKTCFGNSVESFCVNRNTPPFGSSTSSPKITRRESSFSPRRNVLFTVSPIRYLPGGKTSLSIFGIANVTGAMPKIDKEVLPPGKYRIGDTVNKTLRLGLKEDSRRVIFGEDVEDPKGGVFRLTQKLSTEFPKQVFNSPLAESTILGVACGLAAYGRRPVFELQFIDFIYPGFNQLVTNISNLRWRTFGNCKCPAVIYAPYGAYLPG